MSAAPLVTAAPAERARAWPRALAAAAALWLLLDGSILFGTFPYWPRTPARWALLLVAGPAMFLSLAGLFELGLRPRLERASSPRRPASRLARALLLAGAAAGIVAFGAWWTLRVEG